MAVATCHLLVFSSQFISGKFVVAVSLCKLNVLTCTSTGAISSVLLSQNKHATDVDTPAEVRTGHTCAVSVPGASKYTVKSLSTWMK